MPAIPNFCRGNVGAISAPFATGSVFQLGELVASVSNLLVPASAFTWTTDLATTRTNFVAALAGASLQQCIDSVGGQVYGNGLPNFITIGTAGEFWMAVSGTQPAWGDLVSLSKNPSSNALLPNTVEKVTLAAQAIGTVVEVVGNGSIVIVRLKAVLIPSP